MDGCSISEAATRTGFTPSALRFYDDAGLVQPARTPAGYRRYVDGDLEALGFIGRAKRFGLTLDEIADLLVLLEQEDCAPVQARLRALVDDKLTGAQEQIDALVAFTIELRQVSAMLGHHTPDGPCDDRCGCADAPATTVELAGERPAPSTAPITCTLDPDRLGARLGEWASILAPATTLQTTGEGIRARFADGVDLAALTDLAVDERRCCGWLTIDIRLDAGGVTLDLTGPPGARTVLDTLVAARR